MPPAEAIQIGESCFSHAVEDGRRVYFSNLAPFDSHEVSDNRARQLRIARFAEHGVLRRDLAAAFGVNRSTVQRAVNQLRRQGEAGFLTPRRRRGPSAIDAATAREAERLLASGLSGRRLRESWGSGRARSASTAGRVLSEGGRRTGPCRRRRQRRRSRRRRQCWSRRWSRRRSHRRRQRRSRGWSGANGTHATARRRWVGAPGTRRGGCWRQRDI